MRIAIIGSPRAGKTTLAVQLGSELGLRVVSSDAFISLGWSRASDEVAELMSAAPGIYEGVAVVRALRKLLARSPMRPVDRVIVLAVPRVQLRLGQETMRKACETMLAEIQPELVARGVELVQRGAAA